jgi:hypothetical protein
MVSLSHRRKEEDLLAENSGIIRIKINKRDILIDRRQLK